MPRSGGDISRSGVSVIGMGGVDVGVGVIAR